MHISSGSLRGRKLLLPETLIFRPTSGKVRQALFNIVQQSIEGSSFLDICAGSGAMGIEAISRGARRATFIEKSPLNSACIARNLQNLKVEGQTELFTGDARKVMKKLIERGASFDIIYFDPPYADIDLVKELFLLIAENPSILAPGGTLFIELLSKTSLTLTSTSLVEGKSRLFGETKLIVYVHASL